MGVVRQYLGCIGKVDGGLVVVTLHGICATGDLPLTGQRYLNEEWAQDEERRKVAKVPKTITFRTKPQIALDLIDSVMEWGLPLGRAHGDAGYGGLDTLKGLRAKALEHYLARRVSARLRLPAEPWIPAEPTPRMLAMVGRVWAGRRGRTCTRRVSCTRSCPPRSGARCGTARAWTACHSRVNSSPSAPI